MLVHAGLLLVSGAALRIYPRAQWKPSGTEQPTFAILSLLALTVGLPYFLLSTTGPLVQAWYARRFHGAPALCVEPSPNFVTCFDWIFLAGRRIIPA